jgi:hypothetical protein
MFPSDDASPSIYGGAISVLNKSISDPALRDVIASAVAASVNKSVPKQLWPTLDKTREAAELRGRGLVDLGLALPPAAIAVARAHFEKCKPHLIEGDLEHFSTADIFDAPGLVELILQPRILHFVRDYLGAPATITDVAAWWTNPGRGDPGGAQRFHRDRGGLRTCKIFLYLTDVAGENGPHEYVLGSANLADTAQWLKSRGFDDRTVSRMFEGNAREAADEVATAFGERVASIQGPSGTCFITNNFGLHRGCQVRSGRRLLFEALYSLSALPERQGSIQCRDIAALTRRAGGDALAEYALRLVTRLE